jgi:hypothetical protein
MTLRRIEALAILQQVKISRCLLPKALLTLLVQEMKQEETFRHRNQFPAVEFVQESLAYGMPCFPAGEISAG